MAEPTKLPTPDAVLALVLEKGDKLQTSPKAVEKLKRMKSLVSTLPIPPGTPFRAKKETRTARRIRQLGYQINRLVPATKAA